MGPQPEQTPNRGRGGLEGADRSEPFRLEDLLDRLRAKRAFVERYGAVFYREQFSHEPNIATPRFWITHRIEMTEERRLSLETKRKLGYAALGVMEGHLSENDFFVADRYTIADVALYAYTHVANEGGFDLEGFPAVRAWMDRVASQPGYVPITRG